MKRSVGIVRILSAAFVLWALAATAGAAAVPPPPSVDRDASEAAFFDAYAFFLDNRLWNCLDSLTRAERDNIYFVDVYYMRSLALRRLGRYPEAIAAMTAYLEVRREDHRGRLILDTMVEEWDILRRNLHSASMEASLSFRRHTANTFLGVAPYEGVALTGMNGAGKLSASGRLLFLCDTLGDRLWMFHRTGARARYGYADIESPAAFLPVSPGEGLLFRQGGEVVRVVFDGDAGKLTLFPRERVSANHVADAAILDSTLLAVADRTGQAVRFYGMPSLGEMAAWRPDDSAESEKLFEPVALAAFGPFLAVADRGNGRVYLLDVYTLSVRSRIDISAPRDVDWGNQGELYILSEEGALAVYTPFASGSADIRPLVDGLENAWSFVWSGEGPVVSDVAGRSWWVSRVSPGNEPAFGGIALHGPWIEERDGAERLMLRGAASSFYHDLLQKDLPLTQVVWRNEVRPSRVVAVGADDAGGTRFYSPSADYSGLTGLAITSANAVGDILSDIAARSRAGEAMPRVIVMDTRISGSPADMEMLLAFLLQQGVRLDLWTIGRPPELLLERISRMTLGYRYYSRVPETVPFNESVEWLVAVPLPPDTATFGYPSEATLSFFATLDVIRFADWLPIWPSLIRKTGGTDGATNDR